MDALGGSIHERKRLTVTGKTVWHWSLTGRHKIELAISILLPYLVVKRKRAEMLVEFCANIPGTGQKISEAQMLAQIELHTRIKQ